MATLTRLASTLTAKYFPSQTLTDAFYMDGRLLSKREARQADITTDKEERGFFYSVFAHPRINGYEPGMDILPPYEKQLLNTLNEVKLGRKPIDNIIEGFMSTAVDVTGKMRLQDNEVRSPYFAGVIVKDSEAFAVTIGSGLAFLYRDDTLFPLTDAGVPMEHIDCNGNRVPDFLNYCSSKTATAMWSNYFTVSPDDCIILCNKEIYDALGQKEILRILTEADDQCDAAGNIIYQASARMPNVPMQFSISFVESVTSDEKKGLFGFRKKNKEEDYEDIEVHSTFDDGVIGAAAQAAADAGFASGLGEITESSEATSDAIMFGDNKSGPVVPTMNQVASEDKGFEVTSEVPEQKDSVEFLDTSINTSPVVEMSAEDMMKSLFGAGAGVAGAAGAATVAAETTAAAETAAASAAVTETPFVASAFNPFDLPAQPETPEMKPISSTPFEAPAESEAAQTKPIEKLDADFISTLQSSGAIKNGGITEAALKELNIEPTPAAVETPAEPEVKAPSVGEAGELVFEATEPVSAPTVSEAPSIDATFNPYSVGDTAPEAGSTPFVFGDDLGAPAPAISEVEEVPMEDSDLKFDMPSQKPDLKEEDKLPVDFPVAAKVIEETPVAPVAQEKPAEEGFALPFENAVETIPEEKPATVQMENDIPEMPLFNNNTFDTPVVAVSSEEPINSANDNVYTYGQYTENENMAAPVVEQPVVAPVIEQPVAPVVEQPQVTVDSTYQPFGNEGGNYSEFTETNPYQYTNDAAYQPNPGEYVNQSATSANEDIGDSWINDLLGIDGMDMGMNNGEVAMDMNNQNAVAGQSPRTPVKKPAANRTAGARSGGNGNGRGGRKIRKLNRNGYIFLAFVVVLLIAFIIMIAMIAKSCSKDDTKESKDTSETTVASQVSESAATTPTQNPEESNNPSAPIGQFVFSDYIGYRTWWDLFNRVYGIQIENMSDSRIQTIVSYNGLDAGYTPNSGDVLLLPPLGVIDGTIVNTFVPGNAQVAAPNEDGDIISGEISIADDTADAPAEGGEEAPAEGEAQ